VQGGGRFAEGGGVRGESKAVIDILCYARRLNVDSTLN